MSLPTTGNSRWHDMAEQYAASFHYNDQRSLNANSLDVERFFLDKGIALNVLESGSVLQLARDICYRKRHANPMGFGLANADSADALLLANATPDYSAQRYHNETNASAMFACDLQDPRTAYDGVPLASKPRLMAAVSAEPKPSRWERFKAHHATLLAYHIGLYLAVASLFFYCAYRVGVIVGGGR